MPVKFQFWFMKFRNPRWVDNSKEYDACLVDAATKHENEIAKQEKKVSCRAREVSSRASNDPNDFQSLCNILI